jgi:hypothetical protein
LTKLILFTKKKITNTNALPDNALFGDTVQSNEKCRYIVTGVHPASNERSKQNVQPVNSGVLPVGNMKMF